MWGLMEGTADILLTAKLPNNSQSPDWTRITLPFIRRADGQRALAILERSGSKLSRLICQYRLQLFVRNHRGLCDRV